MSEQEMYLKMAEWLRAHTFHPAGWAGGEDCGCFLSANCEVKAHTLPLNILQEVIATDGFAEFDLQTTGWTKGCTDDAVAACLIAADLAAP